MLLVSIAICQISGGLVRDHCSEEDVDRVVQGYLGCWRAEAESDDDFCRALERGESLCRERALRMSCLEEEDTDMVLFMERGRQASALSSLGWGEQCPAQPLAGAGGAVSGPCQRVQGE